MPLLDPLRTRRRHASAEYPADSGFGEAALADFEGAKFVPAFRNGEPVACSIRLPVYYQAPPR